MRGLRERVELMAKTPKGRVAVPQGDNGGPQLEEHDESDDHEARALNDGHQRGAAGCRRSVDSHAEEAREERERHQAAPRCRGAES
jgi:hypothetical protein